MPGIIFHTCYSSEATVLTLWGEHSAHGRLCFEACLSHPVQNEQEQTGRLAYCRRGAAHGTRQNSSSSRAELLL